MSVSTYPVGFTADGDNVAPDGHILGLYLIADVTTTITGMTFFSPADQTISARAYAIGGSGGGDGNPLWTGTGIAVETGDNQFPFTSPLTLIAGRRYLFVIALPDGGHFGSTDNGSVPLGGGVFSSVNEYWGVRVLDTNTFPTNAIMAVALEDPPWVQALRYYGVGIYYETLPSKVSFIVNRISNTETSVAFTMPGDAPDGVTIARCPGSEMGNDGEGRPPSDPAYDPSTIAGAVVIAEGLMSSPYADTGLTPGIYTYWVARTEEV